MSSRELSEWMAFWEMDPFGPTRDNLHAAQLASLIYNANRKKSSKPLTTNDFMYKDRQAKRESDTAQFLSGMRALAKPKVH